jgi:hypothetical protein
MPPGLRTLPERHGGRVVLALLIAILALGLALRVQAALTPPEDVGNDAAAYMAIAKGIYTEGRYGGPSQQAPNDWSPGAPLLYAGVYFLTGGVHVKAALLLVVAFCGVLAPWTARNSVVLDRFVPVTTGGGKALFVATYLPGDGRQQLVKRQLIERYYGKKDLPYEQVRDTEMEPLLNRVAKEYPDLGRDAALARIGRENFVKYATEQPLDYAWMVIRKIQNMWDRGSSAAMSPKFWFAYHKVLVFWALAALLALAYRRRWEAVPIGLTILGITLIGGLLLAVPRRALPLMPFVIALAGVTIAWLAAAVPAWRRAILPRARWSSQPSESSASASRPA